MLTRFTELEQWLPKQAPATVAVAWAQDAHTLEAVLRAAREGLLRYRLVGKAREILALGEELGYAINAADITEAETEEAAARLAVGLVRSGEADFLQKGKLPTATLLRQVVNKETGIGRGRLMSHLALLELPGYPKLLGVTDGGMVPHPGLEEKKVILENALELFWRLGYDRPLAAALCGAETVSPKLPETVDAAALKEAALAGDFGPCVLEGPISFDLATDPHSARIKGYDSPVAGQADLLLTPDLAAGNLMVKGLTGFAGAKMVGVVLGARCPIALNSRSADPMEKYNALLLCACLAGDRKED